MSQSRELLRLEASCKQAAKRCNYRENGQMQLADYEGVSFNEFWQQECCKFRGMGQPFQHFDVQKGVDKVKKTFWMYMVLGVSLLLLAPSARANSLSPGSIVTPDNFNGLAAGSTWLASYSYFPWSYSTTSGTTSGLYEEAVMRDPANPYGGTADITFLVAVQNNSSSTDSLQRITVSSFGTFLADVGYDNTTYCGFSPCSATLVDPTSVDRSKNGNVIGFNYTLPSTLDPGDWSSVLLIFTNAPTYVPGQVALIDTATYDLGGYAPSIPEPATLSLLGMGLLGLLGLRKKK
jgi:hypothetical protein